MSVVAAVDLGKSQCRIRLSTGGDDLVGPGSPGLAAAGGVSAAHDAVLALLPQGLPHAHIVVGAAGAWFAPDAAAELAARLAQPNGAQVAVTSDVVTAHAGALDGAPGVLLIAGTGAVALGLSHQQDRLVDGWGPDLGDFGSGCWVGRQGVQAVLRADAGLGESTALTAAAAEHMAPHTTPVAWLAAAGSSARQLATFAPRVLDAAEAGDAVAKSIAQEAAELLTATAVVASPDTGAVALHGGVTSHGWFRQLLTSHLHNERRSVVEARGDALAGAMLLASTRELPHERLVVRVP